MPRRPTALQPLPFFFLKKKKKKAKSTSDYNMSARLFCFKHSVFVVWFSFPLFFLSFFSFSLSLTWRARPFWLSRPPRWAVKYR